MIASGYIERNDPYWPAGWQDRAIRIHKNWAESVGQPYVLVTNEDVEPWLKHAKNSDSWQFATLCKYVAIQRFLDSDDDSFLWLDLDCIPMDKAYFSRFERYSAAHWAETNFVQFAKVKDKHRLAKACWHGVFNRNFKAVTTMLFCLTRNNADMLLNFAGMGCRFGSEKWWQKYENRKEELLPLLELLWGDPADCNVWELGSEEAIFEQWLNLARPDIQLLPDSVVANFESSKDSLFRHYHGPSKSLIKTIQSVWG